MGQFFNPYSYCGGDLPALIKRFFCINNTSIGCAFIPAVGLGAVIVLPALYDHYVAPRVANYCLKRM